MGTEGIRADKLERLKREEARETLKAVELQEQIDEVNRRLTVLRQAIGWKTVGA